MTVPENKHIAATLSLSLEANGKGNAPVPEKGVVSCTQYDLEDRFKSFVFSTSLYATSVLK